MHYFFSSQMYERAISSIEKQWKLKHIVGEGSASHHSYHSAALWPEEASFCAFNLLNETPPTADDSCCALHACTYTVRNATLPLLLCDRVMGLLNKTRQSETKQKMFKKPLSELARNYIMKEKI